MELADALRKRDEAWLVRHGFLRESLAAVMAASAMEGPDNEHSRATNQQVPGPASRRAA
jgi:hypothetical protein